MTRRSFDRRTARRAGWLGLLGALALGLHGCGGGGGGSGGGGVAGPNGVIGSNRLEPADVSQVIGQAVNQANAVGVGAHIAIVDRVGNVLAVASTTANAPPATIAITSQRGDITQATGLEGVAGVVDAKLGAIAKAITGAYLSSNGNAFTTRTASYIVQEHFPPTVHDAAGGPLFGVQFSQLPCSDLNTNFATTGSIGAAAGPGPHRSPLGLSADPGGLPLYKNGEVVGGIGVLSDGIYTIDVDPTDFDAPTNNKDELIALAGMNGFGPPDTIRANLISVGVTTLRYIDADGSQLNPVATSGAFTLVSVPGYYAAGAGIRQGAVFPSAQAGYRRDTENNYPGVEAFVLVDAANTPRFPPVASSLPTTAAGGMTADEVRAIMGSGLRVAFAARAQIRRPQPAFVQVTISIVDRGGKILAVARTPDAPIFGTDVSLQKARSAALISRSDAATLISTAGTQVGPAGLPKQALGAYVTATRSFLGDGTALANGVAFTTLSFGNISRPLFPDGIDSGTNGGPLARPFAVGAGFPGGPSPQWSVFSTGIQLDAVRDNIVSELGGSGPPAEGCAGTEALSTGFPAAQAAAGDPADSRLLVGNGFQIFSGGVPIYRGNTLVGAIGISGDGITQDGMVAFLGIARSGTGLSNAPLGIRATSVYGANVSDNAGTVVYILCPPAPFLDSTDQNVCDGI